MPRSRIELDHVGLAEILASDSVRAVVHGLAETIAEGTRAALPDEAERGVVVDDYHAQLRRDPIPRVASSVTVRDVRALAWQARHGVLSTPARVTGAEVRER